MDLFKIFRKKKTTPPISFGFWEKLRSKKPLFVLAPMADVTDCVFRQIIAKYSKHGGENILDDQGKFTRQSAERVGGPDVFWTEFVSADGLASPKGREALLVDLKYGESEHPIVAQLFGANAENMESAARLCRDLGFDGIDINMGCPDRSIEKSKSGAYAMKDPKLARRIVEAARAGSLPVSVKTRLGYNSVDWGWVKEVLSWRLPVVTFHLRTRKEMSLVPAHWELMPEIIAMRDEISPNTIVIGNGDAENLDDARVKAVASGADGVMLGRAIFGNPWLFDEDKKELSIEEKLRVCLEHTKLFSEKLLEHKSFNIMKKHYKAYVNGFPGAKELRMAMMEAPDYESVEKIALGFLDSRNG